MGLMFALNTPHVVHHLPQDGLVFLPLPSLFFTVTAQFTKYLVKAALRFDFVGKFVLR